VADAALEQIGVRRVVAQWVRDRATAEVIAQQQRLRERSALGAKGRS